MCSDERPGRQGPFARGGQRTRLELPVTGAARRADRSELAEQVRALLPDGLIDELLVGVCTQEQITGPDGLLGQLTRRLVERAMEIELSDHLGYEPHQEPPGGTGNTSRTLPG